MTVLKVIKHEFTQLIQLIYSSIYHLIKDTATLLHLEVKSYPQKNEQAINESSLKYN